MPYVVTGRRYQSCCGKVVCSGCVYAPVYDDQGNVVTKFTCPFCRTPPARSNGELIERVKKLVDTGNANAIYNFGNYHFKGEHGYPQDITMALELWHRAAELGHSRAYYNIGITYNTGDGVELDEKKAMYYLELAAMRGEVDARYNLGALEETGNIENALKHYMIAVRDGDNESLKRIQVLCKTSHATKDDYAKALNAYQSYLDEIWSDQRNEAAEYNDQYKYY